MTTALLRFPQAIGQGLIGSLDHVGRVSLLVVEMVRGLPQVRTWFPLTVREAYNVGVGSLFIVLLVSGFAGAVTALQAGYQFTGNIPYYVVGSLVVESVVLELGPVLTGLILAGRIGARYARSSASYLVIPRVLAGLLMVPVLVVVADLVGVVSGWWFARQVLPLTDADFVYGARAFWHPFDAYYSLIKAFFFAVSITIIPCYMGFSTQQGAEGVGRATTYAVVASSVMILLLDTILAQILLH
jgi:phospholipid/cholesterol/gamma-HCH transport system permease protein